MQLAEQASSRFVLQYLLDTQFEKISSKHFNDAYDRIWKRTPVFFATQTYKELSNLKNLGDIYNPINYFRKQTRLRVAMVVRTSKKKYDTILTEGAQLTDDIGKIAKLMDTSIKSAYIKMRAMQISRTETVFASNVGMRSGAIATGLPIVKTWVSAGDANVRVNHAVVDGQTKPLNEAFVVGGELMMFPSDFTHGATAGNLVNCRCIEAYSIVK